MVPEINAPGGITSPDEAILADVALAPEGDSRSIAEGNIGSHGGSLPYPHFRSWPHVAITIVVDHAEKVEIGPRIAKGYEGVGPLGTRHGKEKKGNGRWSGVARHRRGRSQWGANGKF